MSLQVITDLQRRQSFEEHVETTIRAVHQNQPLETFVIETLQQEHQERDALQHIGPATGFDISSQLNTTDASREVDFGHASIATNSPDVSARGSEVLAKPFSNTQFQLRFSSRCNVTCHCSCHKQRHLRSSSVLSSVLGSLFIGYSAFPSLFDGKCDSTRCTGRSSATATIVYIFPHWALCRGISMILACHQGQSSSTSFEYS